MAGATKTLAFSGLWAELMQGGSLPFHQDHAWLRVDSPPRGAMAPCRDTARAARAEAAESGYEKI